MISYIFEIAMLLCFAAAWPPNILKAWRSRSTKSVSLAFVTILEVGYVFGMANKIINGIDLAMAFYILDFVLVAIYIALYFRNRRIEAAEASSE